MVIFRQLFDPQSSTYTYLLADAQTGECVLIDPVFEQCGRDASFIRELGLELLWTLETHIHADHVTGAWLLKQRLGSKIAVCAETGATDADRLLGHGDKIAFGDHFLEVRATPGHTNGCLTYVTDDKIRAFTGDALLIRGCGRTDFQQGDARTLFHSIKEQIFTLPDNCLLFPGHDYRGAIATSVNEEKRFNPRIGGEQNEIDFVGYMSNLSLPHPKQMDIAVPANLCCGRLAEDKIPAEPTWAHLNLTFAGIWEITPHSLEECSGKLQIIDVREPEEFMGSLGHIADAVLIPLGELAKRVGELRKEEPVVAVCRSGARSAQATLILRKAGFEQVAKLSGGMLRWQASGHRVVGGFDYDAGL
jgi:sulfur dioxygenase